MPDVWSILLKGAGCILAVTVYLKAVADGVGYATASLEQLDQAQRRMLEKRNTASKKADAKDNGGTSGR